MPHHHHTPFSPSNRSATCEHTPSFRRMRLTLACCARRRLLCFAGTIATFLSLFCALLSISYNLLSCPTVRGQPRAARGRLEREATTREARPTFPHLLLTTWASTLSLRSRPGGPVYCRSGSTDTPLTAAATGSGPRQSEPAAPCCPSKGPNPTHQKFYSLVETLPSGSNLAGVLAAPRTCSGCSAQPDTPAACGC